MDTACLPYLGNVSKIRQPPFGQGQCAATILTEGGYNYPIIRQQTYIDSSKCHTAPCGRNRGLRPMHSTTFTMTTRPLSPANTFHTTNNEDYGRRKGLVRFDQALPFPSQHRGQLTLASGDRGAVFVHDSHYSNTYCTKPIIPVNSSGQHGRKITGHSQQGGFWHAIDYHSL